MSAGTQTASLQALQQKGLWFRASRMFLVMLIFVLPMEAVTAVREITMGGAVVFLALHLWVSGERHFRATVLFWPLLLYFLAAAASLHTAVDFSYSLRELRGEVLKGLLFFYLGVHFVRDSQHLKQVWGAFMWGLAMMGVMGVIYFFYQGGSMLHHQVRAASMHNGYGAYGTYLVTVWPLLLLAPRAFDLPRMRPVWWLLMLLTAFMGYLTYGRAMWFAMLVELGLCMMVLSRHRLRVAVVALALAVMVMAAAFVMIPGASHGERWNKLFASPEQVGGTAGDLVALWKHSLKKIAEHPFTGIGMGRRSFAKAYTEFRATHQPLLWHAHNMFVDLALQTGLQGMAAILWAIVTLVWVLWPKAPPARGDVVKLFGAACAVMVIGFTFRNMWDDFFVDDNGLMFWLIAGLAMGGRAMMAERQEKLAESQGIC